MPIPPENVHACVHGGAVAEEAAVVGAFGFGGCGRGVMAMSAVGVAVVTVATGGRVIVAGLDEVVGGGATEGENGDEDDRHPQFHQ